MASFIQKKRVGARLIAWKGVSGRPALLKAAGDAEKAMVDNKKRGYMLC